MKSLARALENFGDPGRGRESDADRALKAAVAAARGEGHAAGYAEGFAAALASTETEDRAVVMALREAIRDLELQQAGARLEAVAALKPVLLAIVRIAAPRAAAAGLADSLAEAVSTRLNHGTADRLTARVAPERLEALRAAFGDEALVLVPDPALGPAEAVLDWASGGAVFDAGASLAAAEAVIVDFFEASEDERLRYAG